MAQHARRDVFQALADPTRRQIIDLISTDAMSINSIAEKFEVSRPAISQHIKVLIECDIVELETVGRERYCKLRTQSLIPAFLWLEQYQKQWVERLDSFENYLGRLHKLKEKEHE